MTKRLTALLLSVMMVVTLLPAGVFAADDASGGVTAPAMGKQSSSAVNELIYSAEGIDHNWYTLSGVNSAVKIIDSGDYNKAPLPTNQIVNKAPIDTSGSADGTVKNMPENTNTWAYGYVVEFSGFSGKAEISLPFGATVQKADGSEKTCGQGITVGTIINDTRFEVYTGVYVLMISAVNVYGSDTDHRIISKVHELYLAKKAQGSMNVRVLGSVAATVSDISAITGDAGKQASAYKSTLHMTVDGADHPFEDLTAGAIGVNADGTIKNGVLPRVTPPAFPSLTISKPTPPKVTTEGYVNNLVGFAAEDGGVAAIFYTDNGDETITLDSYARELYSVWYETPAVAAPEKQNGWFGRGEKVSLPSGGSISKTPVWRGNADFGKPTDGFTIAFKVEGADQPIIGGGATPTFTTAEGYTYVGGSGNPNGYAFNDRWSPYTKDFDGITDLGGAMRVGTLTNGYHYIYYNRKPMVMKTDDKYMLTALSEYQIFDRNTQKSNPNENATFQMLGVVGDNLNPTVNFIVDGQVYATYTKAYTNYSGYGADTDQNIGDPLCVVRGNLISTEDAFASLGKETPAQPNKRLVWVDEYGRQVEAVYQSQNLYAKFIDDTQASVTFMNASDEIIRKTYVQKGSAAAFDGITPKISTTAAAEYVFQGWTTEKGSAVTENLETYPITEDTVFYPVFTSKVLPTVTIFDNPVSAPFGTKANLLPGGFTSTVSGLTGYTMILKIDGIPYGESAVLGGLRPVITAADGKTYDPLNCGNWVKDEYRTNSHTFAEDGYYLCFFPFKSIVNYDLDAEKTVAGKSKLNSFSVFDKSGALGNGDAANTTANPDITVTLVGMAEGNITPYEVTAKIDGGAVLAAAQTTANVNALDYTNYASWTKLDTGCDLFGEYLGVADGTQYISSWTDENSKPIEYILNEKVICPKYSPAVPIEVTPSGSGNTAYEKKDYAVDITLGAETVDSAAVTLEYDKDVFTNPHLANGTVLNDCPQGAILTLNGAKTAAVLFDIPENAVGGDYTIDAYGTCVTGGDTITAKAVCAGSVTVTGQQPGAYFGESENGGKAVKIYQTNENNSAVDGNGNEVDEQTVWTGDADFGGEKETATFVFKVDGVTEDINATRIHFTTSDGKEWKTTNSQWSKYWGADADGKNGFSSALTFPAGDGAAYYYLTLGKRYINDDYTNFKGMKKFTLFKKDPSANTTVLKHDTETQAAYNKNDKATFEMLAVIGGNLAPQVEFYSDKDGGKLIGSYTYKYPEAVGYKNGTGANSAMKKFGTLAAVRDAFEKSGYETPFKRPTAAEAYEFDGWVDENGNDVSDAPIYKAQRVYAKYKPAPLTESTVTLINEGTVYESQTVGYNGTVVAPEKDPTKPDNATGRYIFRGWALEKDGEPIDLENYPITSDLRLYASYRYEDVTLTVTYMNEGVIVSAETVIRSKRAMYKPIVTKATDPYGTPNASYYKFAHWAVKKAVNGNDVYEKTDLTNIRENVTVYAQYTRLPVENWYTVNWIDKDGTVLDTAKVAAGDGVSTDVTGRLSDTADDKYWYNFSGWDKQTANINGNTDVNAVYAKTPVTASILTEHKVTGNFADRSVLFASDKGKRYKWDTKDYHGFSFLIKIEGASAENPVTLGGMKSIIGGIGSDSLDNYRNNGGPLLENITEDGYYCVNIGGSLLARNPHDNISSLTFSDPAAQYGGKSSDPSGKASYTAAFIPHFFTPFVRFFDKDHTTWLATNRLTASVSSDSYASSKVPSYDEVAKLYNGRDLGERFLYWADAEGNKVTQFYDSMDVYAVYDCEHENCTAIGDGIAKCGKCGEVINNAPTVVSGPYQLKAMPKDGTFTVPVVITNNPGLVSITLNVETTSNVRLTDAVVNGTLFAGATVMKGETADNAAKVVIDNSLSAEDVTGNGTLVSLKFTALEEIKTEDTVGITVTADYTSATDKSEPTVYSGLTVNYQGKIEPARVNYDSLGFTVGNTLALNVKLTCNTFEDAYTECDTWTMYLYVDTYGKWKQLSSQTLTKEEMSSNIINGEVNVTFSLAGIPAAYIVNNLKVRFVGNGKYGTAYESEKDKMKVYEGDDWELISFVNYSKKVKRQEPANKRLRDLLNSMLNYASAVQVYKNYKADNLANKDLTEDEKSFTGIDDPNYNWKPYASQKRGVTPSTSNNVKITSSQLLLRTDKVGFRFYFTVDKTVKADTLIAKVTDGNGTLIQEISEFIQVSESENKYYAVFDGFNPTSFGTQVIVSICDKNSGTKLSNTAYDSIPTMARQVANDSAHVSMRPVLSTILAYSNAANKYVGANIQDVISGDLVDYTELPETQAISDGF